MQKSSKHEIHGLTCYSLHKDDFEIDFLKTVEVLNLKNLQSKSTSSKQLSQKITLASILMSDSPKGFMRKNSKYGYSFLSVELKFISYAEPELISVM